MSETSRARQMAKTTSSGVCDPVDRSDAHRTRLFQSPLGLVENLRCHGGRPRTNPEAEGFSPEFQVCLPYRGLFVWHVAGDEVVSDPNQVLFVSGGQAYRLSEPLPGGYAELIVTPSLALLAELLDIAAAGLPSHALFRRRSRRADLRLLLLRARFLHRASTWDHLAAEELVVAILRCAVQADASTCEPSRSTRRLIRRTKEFVEAYLSEPFRLNDVADAVGASPAYLTDVFKRFEGLPLHKYALQSRLGRALVELPHANDLAMLALDLGFSSHSHFAAAFRRAFGCTPSDFRQSTRGRDERRIA